MNLDDFRFFANITTGSVLIPLGIGGFFYKRLSREMKLLLLLTAISFLCDLGGFFSPSFKWNGNYFVSIYIFSQFFILLGLFYYALGNPGLLKPFITLACAYFIFSGWSFMYLQKADMNTFTVLVSAFIFLGLSVYYFYRLLIDLPTLQVHKLPMFWVSVAVLLYFSANLFLFAMSKFLINTMKDNMIVYWSFHNLISVLKNILFAIAFYLTVKPQERALPQS